MVVGITCGLPRPISWMANSMPGTSKRRKSGSAEEQKSGTVLAICPLFLTSDLPLFTGSKPDDKRKG